MKRTVIQMVTCIAALLLAIVTKAEDIKIQSLRYMGPIPINRPIMIDTADVNSKNFSIDGILDADAFFEFNDRNSRLFDCAEPIGSTQSDALHIFQYRLNNSIFAEAKFNVSGLSSYRLLVDGVVSNGGDVKLTPGSHQIQIKCITKRDSTEHIALSVSSKDSAKLELQESDLSLYNINNVIRGKRIRNVSLSPSGRYLITTFSNTCNNGKSEWTYQLKDLQTNRIINESQNAMTWLPDKDEYYTIVRRSQGSEIVVTNPLTGKVQTISKNAPSESFSFLSNDYNKLLVTHRTEGPKDDAEVHEFTTPDDRQPGWRDRYNLQLYDTNTGLSQPLTFGNRNVYANDILSDGKYILASISENCYGKRPTTLMSLLRISLSDNSVDTLIHKDGYIREAKFSPDGKKILVTGSPEAFNGIGKNLPSDRIPNAFDYQLFIIDVATKAVKPITKDFNPSIEACIWNEADNKIYFTANNRDCVDMFVCNPQKDYDIKKISLPEEVITHFSFAKNKPVATFVGESASNSDRLYSLNLQNLRTTLIEDLSSERLNGIVLGDCRKWDFVNSKGDTICGRYYLPPHFDANKKYPMIVYYYGGCSPVPRNFETRYPFHTYAAQDYVVYVLQPSGCAGFGQEFSSRHVNTAGQGPAEDIIEGTKQFLAEHSFVDAKKVGCMGASYGGFMTQYLQTQTDIFAAAISHAGISDHTSYWGEGYWGFSYSEVSMADSYPWTRKDLYVDQSPLYNADKIHTPLLFLHGTADTNVPVGESIQMYTALKLLNRPTALVVVEGENHGINDYSKRIKWQNTIYAWFARWLKDDDSWWKSMYPSKNL